MEDIYYVYEYIRLDTNEPFYIGKGKGTRWKNLSRKYNPKFMRIINKVDVVVNMLKINLSEEEAFEYEIEYIDSYIFDYGYDLANICPGGQGHTGINPRKGTGKKVICINTGEIFNNSRIAGEKYNIEITDIQKCCNYKKRFAGTHNGIRMKWMYYDEYLNNTIKRNEVKSEDYSDSKYVYESRVKPVICINTGKIYDSIKEAEKDTGAYHISRCCRGKRKTSGKDKNGNKLIWRYYNKEKNKIIDV